MRRRGSVVTQVSSAAGVATKGDPLAGSRPSHRSRRRDLLLGRGLLLLLFVGQLVADGLLDGGLHFGVVAGAHEIGDGLTRLLGGRLGLVGLDVAVAVRVRITGQERTGGSLLAL